MAIQMRRGLREDFDPNKMLPGEWAVSIDNSTSNQIVWMCFAAGICKRMGTYEDFEAQIAEITVDIRDAYVADFNEIKAAIQLLADTVASDKEEVLIIKSDITNAYLPQIQELAEKAEVSASDAADFAYSSHGSALTSQSYAVGGTGSRDGEDTDNSKYYSQQSKSEADRAKTEADRAASIAGIDVAKIGTPGIVSPDGVTTKVDENGVISTVFDNSIGTESESGLTKLYSDIGTATDGTMTQKAIGEALDKCMTKDITILLDELGGWTPASSGINISDTSMLLAAAAYGDGKFVIGGYANKVFHSSGGVDWNKPSVCNMYNPNSIAYGNGTFVMVGNHMTEVGLLYSTDRGETWSKGSGITDCTFLYGVTFGNGMFVAVGAGGKTFYSTDDGRTWNEGNGTGSDEMRAITFANGMFIAVGYTIYSSTYGKTWTKRRNADSAVKYAVTYGDGKFVAVAGDGKTYYSTDGKTWLIGNGCGSVDLRGVAYGNGMFVAVGIGGCLFYSFDGISWIAGDSGVSKDLKAIVYAEGKFVIAGSSTVLYAEFATETKKLEDVIGELYNRNKIPYVEVKLASAGWTSSTEYSSCPYVYEVAISDYYDSYPEWFLKPVSGITPTSAEQTAYDLITAMKLDTANMKLKFYATETPSTNILIVVKGVLG